MESITAINMFKGFKRGSEKEKGKKNRSGSTTSNRSFLAPTNASSKPNSPPKPSLEDFGIWMGDEPQIEEKPSEDSESDVSGVTSNNMPDFLKSATELAAEEEERKRKEEEKIIEDKLKEKKRLEKLERDRIEKERLEKEKLERERLEKAKLELEKEKKEALEKERLIAEAMAKKKEPPFPTHIDPFINIPMALSPIEKIDLSYLTSKANAFHDQSSTQPLLKFNNQSTNSFITPIISGSTSQVEDDSKAKVGLSSNQEAIPDEIAEQSDLVPIVPPPTPVCSDPFEDIAYPIFNMADVYHDGLLDYREFALVCNSKTLNLELSQEEIKGIMEDIDSNMDGYITYDDFVPIIREFLSHIYNKLDETPALWIQLQWTGGTRLYFNKKSGEFSYIPPIEHKIALKDDLEEDLVETTLAELFRVTDKDRRGFINLEQFNKIIKSEALDVCLKMEDKAEIARFFQYAENNHAQINQFTLMAKRIIYLISKVRSASNDEWCQLNSNKHGLFWLNKRTMEVTKELPYEFHRRKIEKQEEQMIESALVSKARKDLGETFEELAKLLSENRELMDKYGDLEKQCDEKNHDLRILTTQVTTIRAVLHAKEHALDETSESLKKAEREIERLEKEVVTKNDMKRDLSSTKEALREAKTSASDSEKKINSLKKELRETILQFKDSQIAIEYRDRQMGTMSKQLASYKDKTEALEKEVAIIPDLQRRLTDTEEELQRLRSKYEEKATQLILCRKNLKDSRGKIEILNQELERYPSVCQELDEAKMEVASLKRLIVAKNNLVQQQFRELDLAKSRLDLVEKSEAKKNNILLNVLERTSRYPTNNAGSDDSRSPSPPATRRPTSAPQSPRTGNEMGLDDENITDFDPREIGGQAPKRSISNLDNSLKSIISNGIHSERGGISWSPEISGKSNISRGHKPDFSIPWSLKQPMPSILQQGEKIEDELDISMSKYFPNTRRAKSSEDEDELQLSPVTKNINAVASLALNKGLSSTINAINTEPKLVHMVKIGDRVSARCIIKDDKVDREEIVSGIVKYVGKLDSAYVDNRIYVGLKLDRPVGDTDGVVNGKRYFKSPPNHGKIVRLYDVISVLHPKHIKPLNFQEYVSPRVELAK
ncbi:hypothetical protein TrispH2_005364 [Trichoplax sp. H2]|nr:hypothetical protein TrispH2_005364 [Trichoplax sp. H2]|eukprot:RDD43065.1 hypothetical protein TrispH2_005364 [Trichoplax sp. H2]